MNLEKFMMRISHAIILILPSKMWYFISHYPLGCGRLKLVRCGWAMESEMISHLHNILWRIYQPRIHFNIKISSTTTERHKKPTKLEDKLFSFSFSFRFRVKFFMHFRICFSSFLSPSNPLRLENNKSSWIWLIFLLVLFSQLIIRFRECWESSASWKL